MCLQCIAALNGRNLARRAHVLQLLALVEQPDALPTETALRLAREILVALETDASGRRCDPVVPPEDDAADATSRRLP